MALTLPSSNASVERSTHEVDSPSRAATPGPAAERDERAKFGRSCRKVLRRIDQSAWKLRDPRPDPVRVLLNANRGRIASLLPIKFERMAVSPSGFLRGAVPLMAADLATLPTTGLLTQICGDAHVRNFGAYAAPDGRLIFDINDFDETIRGPWEWDIKRMATSLVVAGRDFHNSSQQCKFAVVRFVQTYRQKLQEFSQMSYLDLARYEVQRLQHYKPIMTALRKAQRATPQQTLEKLTVAGKNGNRIFRDAKPILERLSGQIFKTVLDSLKYYRETMHVEYQQFFDRYTPVDIAFKVVGTSSVGTRDYVLLCIGNGAGDPLFLQVKEENPSVYEKYLKEPSHFANQGQRVVEGQRRMQSRCDIFLGWTRLEGRDFLVRQLRDHKATVHPEDLRGTGLVEYAQVCGELLAKGHARSGDACALSGYCGNSDKLDLAIAKFAFAYAQQNQSDYEKFLAAIKRGKIKVAKSLSA
jgi:uncharacterized protein (DUF2252 family)